MINPNITTAKSGIALAKLNDTNELNGIDNGTMKLVIIKAQLVIFVIFSLILYSLYQTIPQINTKLLPQKYCFHQKIQHLFPKQT